MLHLNEMAIFVAVTQAKSFTLAATQLKMPKSTVSYKITQLEESLGVRLLQRSTRKIKLTERGAEYFKHCLAVVEAAEKADATLQELQQEPRGTLRLSTAPGFMPNFLAEILRTFLEKYQGLNVDVVTSARWLDLIDEGIDLALRIGPLPDTSLIARFVCPIQRYLVASPEYLKNNKEIIRIDDLSQHSCITYDLASSWIFNHKGKAIRYSPQSRVSSNDLQSVKQMALHGLGVAVLPDIWVFKEIQQGQLIRCLPKTKLEERSLHIVYPSRKQVNANITSLSEHIIQSCNPDPPWLKTR